MSIKLTWKMFVLLLKRTNIDNDVMELLVDKVFSKWLMKWFAPAASSKLETAQFLLVQLEAKIQTVWWGFMIPDSFKTNLLSLMKNRLKKYKAIIDKKEFVEKLCKDIKEIYPF